MPWSETAGLTVIHSLITGIKPPRERGIKNQLQKISFVQMGEPRSSKQRGKAFGLQKLPLQNYLGQVGPFSNRRFLVLLMFRCSNSKVRPQGQVEGVSGPHNPTTRSFGKVLEPFLFLLALLKYKGQIKIGCSPCTMWFLIHVYTVKWSPRPSQPVLTKCRSICSSQAPITYPTSVSSETSLPSAHGHSKTWRQITIASQENQANLLQIGEPWGGGELGRRNLHQGSPHNLSRQPPGSLY